MKRILILMASVALIILPGISQANYLGDIALDHGKSADLGYNTHVNVSFSYKVDDAAGARIQVLPYRNGAPHPSYSWQGSILYPQGEGFGSRWCTVSGGASDVDQIVVTLLSSDWSTVLLEMAIPVDYTFNSVGVYDVTFSPTSPSKLLYDTRLDMFFNWRNNLAEDVRIYARGMYEGEPVFGMTSAGSPAYDPGEGTGDFYMYYAGGALIDAVRFQVVSLDQSVLFHEFYVPVDVEWGPHGISNIVVTPPSPQHLDYDMDVEVFFDYETSDAAGIRVWVLGYLNGGWAPGLAYQGSGLESAPSGSISRTFHLLSEGAVDEVRFLMTNDDQSETYLDFGIPADFYYSEHSFLYPTLRPGAPAILDFDERTYVDFWYTTSDPLGVRIWTFPYSTGGYTPGGGFGGSPLYDQYGQFGTQYFLVFGGSDEVLVDQYHVLMTNDDETATYLDFGRMAHHYYGHSAVATSAPEEAPAALTVLHPNFPNPFNPKTTISFVMAESGSAKLGVFDVQGRLVRMLLDESLEAGPHAIDWDGTDAGGKRMSSGVYLAKLLTADQEHTRKMILMK